jgi:hypothetical protein
MFLRRMSTFFTKLEIYIQNIEESVNFDPEMQKCSEGFVGPQAKRPKYVVFLFLVNFLSSVNFLLWWARNLGLP